MRVFEHIHKSLADFKTSLGISSSLGDTDNLTTNGNRFGILGDSIALGNGVHTSSLHYRGNADPLSWAHILSDGRIYYAKNAGVGGNTTAQILARVTDITSSASDIDWCLLASLGTNDALQGIAYATYKANVISIVAAIKAAGIKPILTSIVPSSDATAKLHIPKFNSFLAYYAKQNKIPFVDFYAKLADPAGTGAQLAAYNTGDGTHPSSAGAKVLGQAIVDAVASTIGGWFPPLAIVQTNSQNLLPNGLNVDTNSDGTADSYSKTGTGTATTVAADGTNIGRWQRLVVADGTASTIYQAATTGFSVGDRMAFSCRIKAAPTTPSKINVYLTFVGPFSSHYVVKDVDVAIESYAVYYEFNVPASTTAIRAFIGSTAGGSNADVQFAQVTLLNLTTNAIV